MQKMIEYFESAEGCFYRAHVWTKNGYSSKNFTTSQEAAFWTPKK